MGTGNFGGYDIGEYIEEKRKRAIRNTVILLMCLVLFCCTLQHWISSAKNEAASQKEKPKQDTVINTESSTGTAWFHIRRKQVEAKKAAKDTLKDVHFVDDWENDIEIK